MQPDLVSLVCAKHSATITRRITSYERKLTVYRSYGSSPKQGARCNNSYYNIGFPEGVKDLHKFKLSLVRDPESPITERGQVSVDSHVDGSKWKCVDNPEEHVKIRCNYEGTLEMPISV